MSHQMQVQRALPPRRRDGDLRWYLDEAAAFNDAAVTYHRSGYVLTALGGYAHALQSLARATIPRGERSMARRCETLAWELEAAVMASTCGEQQDEQHDETEQDDKTEHAVGVAASAAMIGTSAFKDPLLTPKCGRCDRISDEKHDGGRVDRAVVLFNAALAHSQLTGSAGHHSLRDEKELETEAECLALALECIRCSSALPPVASFAASWQQASAGNANNEHAAAVEGVIEMAIVCNLGLIRLQQSRPAVASRLFERYAGLSCAFMDSVFQSSGISPPPQVASLLSRQQLFAEHSIRPTTGRGSAAASLCLDSADAMMHYVKASGNLARAYDAEGRHGEALFTVGEALALGEVIQEEFGEEPVCDDPIDLNELQYVEAQIVSNMGNTKWAFYAFRNFRTRTIKDELRAAALHGMGQCLLKREDLVRGTLILVAALTVRQRCLGHNHPDTVDTLRQLSHTLRRREEYADALSTLERAYAMYEEALGPSHERTLEAMTDLAHLHRERNDPTRSMATAWEVAWRLSFRLAAASPATESECSPLLSRLRGLYQGAVLLIDELMGEMGIADEDEIKVGGGFQTSINSKLGNGRCPDAAAA